MIRHRTSHAAFSLVELSVVLVILGLLVGGIITGQALIRGAELNAISSESRKIITAIGQFRDKYSSLPGDMSNASSYWSVGDGSGNGKIQNTAAAGTNEISQFWLHVANAGFVEGSYTPVAGTTTLAAGTNNMRSKLKGGGWNVAYLGTVGDSSATTATGDTPPGATTFFANNYDHVLLFGAGTDALAPTGLLDPTEAYNLDVKLDDGKPDTGDITSLESQGAASGSTRCSDQAASSTASIAASTYVLANSSAKSACSLVFRTGF